MLNVGRIEYSNCTPLFMLLEEYPGAVSYNAVAGVPSMLNKMLAAGEVDVCPCSSIEFARHADMYQILPGHCIGSDGPVQSVMLYSSLPVARLAHRKVFVTGQSATSVVLLKILLSRRFGLEGVSYEVTDLPWQKALQQGAATLLIGDNALMALQDGNFENCYDLGAEWKEWTGLPFVYALWLINKNSVKSKQTELNSFANQLNWVRDRLPDEFGRLAEIEAKTSWMTAEYLENYWRNFLSYQLDQRHIAGVSRYFELASELGLIAQTPELSFWQGVS